MASSPAATHSTEAPRAAAACLVTVYQCVNMSEQWLPSQGHCGQQCCCHALDRGTQSCSSLSRKCQYMTVSELWLHFTEAPTAAAACLVNGMHTAVSEQ